MVKDIEFDVSKITDNVGILIFCFIVGLIGGLIIGMNMVDKNMKTPQEQMDYVEARLLDFNANFTGNPRGNFGNGHYLLTPYMTLGSISGVYFTSGYTSLARKMVADEIGNLCGNRINMSVINSTMKLMTMEELFDKYPQEKVKFKQMCEELK